MSHVLLWVSRGVIFYWSRLVGVDLVLLVAAGILDRLDLVIFLAEARQIQLYLIDLIEHVADFSISSLLVLNNLLLLRLWLINCRLNS